MSILLVLYLVSLAGWVWGAAGAEASPTPIDRDIIVNTVLTREGSPYIITRDIRIKAEVRIEDGVVLIFAPGVTVTVDRGVILAEGKPGSPVTLVGRGTLVVTGSVLVFKNVVVEDGLEFTGLTESNVTFTDSVIRGGLSFKAAYRSVYNSTVALDNVTIVGDFRVESLGLGNETSAVYQSEITLSRVNATGEFVVHSYATGLQVKVPIRYNITTGNTTVTVTSYKLVPAVMYGVYESRISISDSVFSGLSVVVDRSYAGEGAALFRSSLVLERVRLGSVVVEGPEGLLSSWMSITDSTLEGLTIHGYGLYNGTSSGRGLDQSSLVASNTVMGRVLVRGESIADNWVREDWGLYGQSTVMRIYRCQLESLIIDGEKGGVGGRARLEVLYSRVSGPQAVYVKSVVDSTAVVSYSCLEGAEYGLKVEEGYVYAGHNWWGDPSGPRATGNPEGKGSPIVMPWLEGRPNPRQYYEPWLDSRPVWCVEGRPPVAGFWFSPRQPYWGVNVTFYGLLSYDPDGNITGYRWEFGDGTVAEGAIVTHVFEKPGVYNVTLTVVDDTGLTGVKSKTVEVLKRPSKIEAQSFVVSRGSLAHVEARLVDGVSGGPLVGRTLSFYVDGKLVGSARTGRDGVAVVEFDTSWLGVGRHSLAVEFRGDDLYEASRAEAALEVVSYSISLEDYSASPGSVKPGGQALVSVKLRLDGEGSVQSRLEVQLLGRSYSVEEPLFPGINLVQVPIQVPGDAAAGSYDARAVLYIAGMPYASWSLHNLLTVEPVVSATVEEVRVLDLPVVGKSFRVEVKVANTGNTDARLRVRVSIEGLGEAESGEELVPLGGSASFVVNIPVPPTAYPGVYTMSIHVLDPNGKVIATSTSGVELRSVMVEPRLEDVEVDIARRGLTISLSFYNPEDRDAVFLARLVLVKGQGDCVDVKACTIYDYAETVALPARSHRTLDISVNLDTVKLEPLDTLDARLLVYDETGQYLIKEYRVARIPVLELLRRTVEVTVTPGYVAAPPGSEVDVRIDVASGMRIEGAEIVPVNGNDSIARLFLPATRADLEPGEFTTRWATLHVSPGAPLGSETTVYIVLRLDGNTLATVPVRVKVPHVALEVKEVERYRDRAIVEVSAANLDSIDLRNVVVSVKFPSGVEVLDAEPGSYTTSMAVMRVDALRPGDIASMRVKIQLRGNATASYEAVLRAVPDGARESFTLARASGVLAAGPGAQLAPANVTAPGNVTPANATATTAAPPAAGDDYAGPRAGAG
ncbi:hypothetical protein PABY_06980 [Pyrodictium abyssi]|uniref:PKD domain-containing protein n=1 Tax=Pyrodictium abyssi TaxID=54256 RepID=A0ABN6ZLJ4_9CREN|nr:hypothetical protein PABY_06980 [Pyrodictium abyssi]